MAEVTSRAILEVDVKGEDKVKSLNKAFDNLQKGGGTKAFSLGDSPKNLSKFIAETKRTPEQFKELIADAQARGKPQLAAALQKQMEAANENVGQSVSKIGETISSGAKGWGASITNAMQQTGATVSRWGANFASGLARVGSTIGTTVHGWASSVAGLVGRGLTAGRGLMGGIASRFADWRTSFAGKVTDKASEVLGLTGRFASALGTIGTYAARGTVGLAAFAAGLRSLMFAFSAIGDAPEAAKKAAEANIKDYTHGLELESKNLTKSAERTKAGTILMGDSFSDLETSIHGTLKDIRSGEAKDDVAEAAGRWDVTRKRLKKNMTDPLEMLQRFTAKREELDWKAVAGTPKAKAKAEQQRKQLLSDAEKIFGKDFAAAVRSGSTELFKEAKERAARVQAIEGEVNKQRYEQAVRLQMAERERMATESALQKRFGDQVTESQRRLSDARTRYAQTVGPAEADLKAAVSNFWTKFQTGWTSAMTAGPLANIQSAMAAAINKINTEALGQKLGEVANKIEEFVLGLDEKGKPKKGLKDFIEETAVPPWFREGAPKIPGFQFTKDTFFPKDLPMIEVPWTLGKFLGLKGVWEGVGKFPGIDISGMPGLKPGVQQAAETGQVSQIGAAAGREFNTTANLSPQAMNAQKIINEVSWAQAAGSAKTTIEGVSWTNAAQNAVSTMTAGASSIGSAIGSAFVSAARAGIGRLSIPVVGGGGGGGGGGKPSTDRDEAD